MSAPSLATEAAASKGHPSNRFNERERQLLASVKTYADSLVPTFKVLAAGTHTSVGGDATESISVSGAASSDIAIVVLKTAGATPRTITTAAAATNAITVVMSGDPSTDHVLSYVVLRAV